MPRKTLGAAIIVLALLTFSAHAAEHPSLVVVISIDQFRYDYLERFATWYGERGFNRFLKSGANFPNTYYRHATTFTAPGHASIATGRTPSEHGVVANAWFDRSLGYDPAAWDWFFTEIGGYRSPVTLEKPTGSPPAQPWYATLDGSPRYSVYDSRVTVSAGKTPGMSPVALEEDSLGDRVKERYPNARVISVALKDRAAVLMGGRKADAAYWFDRDLPGFISSSYYRFDRDAFRFNQRVLSYIPPNKTWSPLLSREEMASATFDPPEAVRLKRQTYGGTFDHQVPHVRALTYTPFANDLLLDFAMSVIDLERLGTRADSTDLLFVGVSAPDYIGHYYGPDSMEVMDDAIRLDRSLQAFIDALEQRFDKRLLIAITADHGVQSNPDVAKLRDPKADSGRIDLLNPLRDARTIAELPPPRIEIERRLAERLRVRFSPDAPLTDALVLFFEEPSLYLNWHRIAELKLDGERVKLALRDVLLSMRKGGIDQAFTNTELMARKQNRSDVESAVRASFRPDRMGDVIVTLRAGWIWGYSPPNTTHGQPVPADMHVPLLLWGAGIKPGRYDERVAPTDLAKTIGVIVGVEVGSQESRVLPCAQLSPMPAHTP